MPHRDRDRDERRDSRLEDVMVELTEEDGEKHRDTSGRGGRNRGVEDRKESYKRRRSSSDRHHVKRSSSSEHKHRREEGDERRRSKSSRSRSHKSRRLKSRSLSEPTRSLQKENSSKNMNASQVSFRGKEVTSVLDLTVKGAFSRNKILILVWILWLLLGTCFYILVLDLTIAEGFYMAVNIGYSIGWGDISEIGELASQLFSTIYVLIGASFVGAGLGIFAERIMADKEKWYEQEKENLVYEENIKDCNKLSKAWYFFLHHKEKFRPIILWFLFVITCTIAAWGTNEEFGFGNALYFAVSSLSTGGHYVLPTGNSQWVYGLTGLYCAFGVPLMGVAMATIASFFIKVGSIEDTLKSMKKPVTRHEVDMLTEFGLADNDGEIDKSEFIILCMVRTGAASPELIKLIELYFNELDDDNSGSLSIDEILRNRQHANEAAAQLLEDVKHTPRRDGRSRYEEVEAKDCESPLAQESRPRKDEKYYGRGHLRNIDDL